MAFLDVAPPHLPWVLQEKRLDGGNCWSEVLGSKLDGSKPCGKDWGSCPSYTYPSKNPGCSSGCTPVFDNGSLLLAVGGVALEGGGGETNCTCRRTAGVVTAGVFGDAVALVAVATASLAAAVGCGVPGDLRIRDVVAARLNVLAIP